ncbi:EF-hand domain-containing protein [Algibacter sp. 2305UL17-15]|uniref:EF-hand domain-containing protein n=1 Tax=Algibacter sp. 2305UL17-15 TaxID=3231268 RepID=UPI00345B1926
MKREKLRIVLLILGVTCFVANSSFGQSENKGDRKERPTFEQLLEKMDANEDGKLSKKEVKGPLKKNFDEVDADEDGFITEEELKKAPKPKRRERN